MKNLKQLLASLGDDEQGYGPWEPLNSEQAAVCAAHEGLEVAARAMHEDFHRKFDGMLEAIHKLYVVSIQNADQTLAEKDWQVDPKMMRIRTRTVAPSKPRQPDWAAELIESIKRGGVIEVTPTSLDDEAQPSARDEPAATKH